MNKEEKKKLQLEKLKKLYNVNYDFRHYKNMYTNIDNNFHTDYNTSDNTDDKSEDEIIEDLKNTFGEKSYYFKDNEDLKKLEYIKYTNKKIFGVISSKTKLENYFYLKKIKLNYNGLYNLLFWTSELNFKERKKHVLELISKLFPIEKDIYKLKIYFIEDYNLLDTVVLIDNKVTILAESVLNKNSLDLIQMQNLDNFLSPKMQVPFLKLQTLTKFLFENLDLINISQFMFFGSISLYVYGYKYSDDIDGVTITLDRETMVEKVLMNEDSKIEFVDMGVVNDKVYWRDTWTATNLKVFKFFGINNYNILLSDPSNYFYFQGLKFLDIKFEIVAKFLRRYEKDIADLLMLPVLYPEKFDDLVYIENGMIYSRMFEKLEPFKIKNFMKENLFYIISERYNKNDILIFIDRYLIIHFPKYVKNLKRYV